MLVIMVHIELRIYINVSYRFLNRLTLLVVMHKNLLSGPYEERNAIVCYLCGVVEPHFKEQFGATEQLVRVRLRARPKPDTDKLIDFYIRNLESHGRYGNAIHLYLCCSGYASLDNAELTRQEGLDVAVGAVYLSVLKHHSKELLEKTSLADIFSVIEEPRGTTWFLISVGRVRNPIDQAKGYLDRFLFPRLKEAYDAGFVTKVGLGKAYDAARWDILKSLRCGIQLSEDRMVQDYLRESEAARAQILQDKIDSLLSTLSEPEKEILKLRCGIGETDVLSLNDVGKRFGLSGTSIKRIETKAMRKLKHPCFDESVKEIKKKLDNSDMPGEALS